MSIEQKIKGILVPTFLNSKNDLSHFCKRKRGGGTPVTRTIIMDLICMKHYSKGGSSVSLESVNK